MGKILLNSPEFEKLLNIILNGKIKIQNLSFQREIGEILSLNHKLTKLVHSAYNLCYVYYEQILELQKLDIKLLKRVRFLSIAVANDVGCLKLRNLTQLNHIVLNIFEYPIDLRCISKFLSFAIKLKGLQYLDIQIVIEKDLDLPDCLFEALKIVSQTEIEIKIKILDNDLTYKNMRFDWLNRKIEPVCQYVTDLSMNLNSDRYIDFHELAYYYRLDRLKVSLYYSSNKSGNFRLKNSNLKYLDLYYFNGQMHYSLKYLYGLEKLVINSSDISAKLINSLPSSLKILTLTNCYCKSDGNFQLPLGLVSFKYEMVSLNQNFPAFENISDLTGLMDVTLVLSSAVQQPFISKLPQNLKTLSVSCSSSEKFINWKSMDFSMLKNLTNFQIIGQSSEYDLKLLPPNIRNLSFKLEVSVFKNCLPYFLESLDITFNDPSIPICLTLNSIIDGNRFLEHLNIRSNRLQYDISRLDYKNLKKIKLFIGYGLMKSKAVVRIGNIPSTIIRFEIISNSKETVLMAPKSQLRDTPTKNNHFGKYSDDTSSISSGASSMANNLKYSERLVDLGILEGITDIKEVEVSKINLEKGMSKLKMDNVGNKIKNENMKTKSKIKSFLKMS